MNRTERLLPIFLVIAATVTKIEGSCVCGVFGKRYRDTTKQKP